MAAYRRDAGLTQAKLAERVNVATETISRLECGKAIPSLARLERVARVLAVDLADLFRSAARDEAREQALERLLRALRSRPAEDVEVITDIAVRLFVRRR